MMIDLSEDELQNVGLSDVIGHGVCWANRFL